MDRRDKILQAINAGRHSHANKGFGSWDTKALSSYAKQRARDSKGRFINAIQDEAKPGDGHNMEAGTSASQEKD